MTPALVTATTLLAYATIDRPHAARFVALGLVAGVATLVRSEGLLLLGGLVTTTLVRAALPARRAVALGLASAVTFAAVMAPWTVRNARAFDDPVLLSTNSGGLLEGANCPSTYSGRLLGAWDFDCVTAAFDPELEASTGARTSSERAVDHARDNIGRLPVVAAARVLRMWGIWDPVAQAELEAVESRDEGWQLAGWAYGTATNALAVAGLVLLVRHRATVAPIVALLAAVTGAAVISWGNQRFRLSAEPVLAVLAATALVAIVRRQMRSWRDRRPAASA